MLQKNLVSALTLSLLVVTADGAGAWETLVSETPPASRTLAVAVFANDDIVAVGRAATASALDDAIAARLAASSGAELWRATIAGDAGQDDVLSDVLVDGDGNVIATGQTERASTGLDGLVVKLRGSDGQELWRTDLDGGGGGNDDAMEAVLVDGGDVVVVGRVVPDGGMPIFVLWRLDGDDGGILWRTDVEGANGVGRRLALGEDGFVYAAGHAVAEAGDVDVVVVKIDPATGAVGWRTPIGGSAGGGDAVEDIAVCSTGQVVVAGRLAETGSDDDFAVVALATADGMERWRHLADGDLAGDDADEALSVTIDGVGEVIAAGVLGDAATGEDLVVTKLGGARGAVLWQVVAKGAGADPDRARAIVSDIAGDVVVVGQIHTADRRDDLAVLKLAGTDGAERWRRLIDGPRSGNDVGLDVAFDGAGDVVVAGRLRNEDTGNEMAVVKLSRASGGSFPCGNDVVDAGEACDDGNLDPTDECVACEPPRQCQEATCDPTTGTCEPVNVQNGIPCDDADACTFSDRCVDGVCTGGAAVVCNDGNPCTVDACEPLTGCTTSDLTHFGWLTCAFGNPAIVNACPSLPEKIGKQLEKGEGAGAKAAGAMGRRARRLLKAAIKAWRKAAQRAERTPFGDDFSADCAAAVMQGAELLIGRARDLRASL